MSVFCLATYIFLSIIGKRFFNRSGAIAMMFEGVMWDLFIALAIAMITFGKEGLT